MGKDNLIVSKKAFFHDGEQQTEYIYDHSITTKYVTALWTNGKERLSIFSNMNGRRICSIQFPDDNMDFDVYDTAIIIKDNDSHLQGAKGLKEWLDIIPIKYLKIDYISEYLIATTPDNKKGLYASDGLHILDDIYDEINIMDHYIEVVLENKHGLYSFNGTELITPIYDKLSFGLHCIKGIILDDKCSLFSYTGKKFFDIEKNDRFSSSNYGVVFNNGKKVGFFAFNGNCILPPEYDSIDIDDCSLLNNPLINMKKGGKNGLCSIDGKIILLPEFDIIRIGARTKDNHFSSEYITVYAGGKCGVYSFDSSLVLPVIFDQILEFNEVVSKVVLNTQVGYYLLKEKKFINASDFNVTKTGIYEIKKDDKWEILTLD